MLNSSPSLGLRCVAIRVLQLQAQQAPASAVAAVLLTLGFGHHPQSKQLLLSLCATCWRSTQNGSLELWLMGTTLILSLGLN